MAQLEALAASDAARVFRFASPANQAATGPSVDRFAEMLGAPQYRPLLGHLGAEVLRSVQMKPDVALLIVGEFSWGGGGVRARCLVGRLVSGCLCSTHTHAFAAWLPTPACPSHSLLPHLTHMHTRRRDVQPAHLGARRHAASSLLLDCAAAGGGGRGGRSHPAGADQLLDDRGCAAHLAELVWRLWRQHLSCLPCKAARGTPFSLWRWPRPRCAPAPSLLGLPRPALYHRPHCTAPHCCPAAARPLLHTAPFCSFLPTISVHNTRRIAQRRVQKEKKN